MPRKKNVKVISEKQNESSKTLFSVDTGNFNPNATWIKSIGMDKIFKVGYNIILIVEILLGQLVTVNGLGTQEAMQSDVHRATNKILKHENGFKTIVGKNMKMALKQLLV